MKADYYQRGRTRMLSDTINWATSGRIYDEDLITGGHFNVYYGDLFGTGEETIPHYANRSLDFLKETIKINREHVQQVKENGMAYIFYSSACSFDDRFFSKDEIDEMEMKFRQFQYMFDIPNRRWACFNSPGWLQYQVDKTLLVLDELQVDGVFFDNIFYMNPCICKHCQDKYFQFTGKSLIDYIHRLPFLDSDEKFSLFDGNEPEKNAMGDPEYLKESYAYTGWRLQCMNDFLKNYKKTINDHTSQYGKSFSVIVNSYIHASENIALYKKGEVDAYFTENGFSYAPKTNIYSYKLANTIERGLNKPTIAITRVLEGNPTTYMLKAQLAEGMAFGGAATPWGFYLHDSLDLKQAANQYFQFMQTHGEMLARQEDISEVAVLQSMNNELLDKFNGNLKRYYTSASVVCSQMLADLHIPFDIVNIEHDLSEELIRRYKLLILPETKFLTEEQGSILLNYLEKGGQILCCKNSLTLDPDFRPCTHPMGEHPRCHKADGEFHLRYLDDRIQANENLAMLYEKYSLLKWLADHHPYESVNLSNSCMYTQMNVTRSDQETLIHLVNMNCNRGPYTAKVMRDRHIRLSLKCGENVMIEAISPDFPEERVVLPYRYSNGKAHLMLPELKTYTIIRVSSGMGGDADERI